MNTNTMFYYITLLALFVCTQSFAQVIAPASIDEGLISYTVYVNMHDPSADDSSGNMGHDSNTPYATIQRAFDRASTIVSSSNAGVRVLIADGIYREQVAQSFTSDTYPVVVRAMNEGAVTITGADVFLNWAETSPGSGVYSNLWTNNWGTSEPPEYITGNPPYREIARRREMAFVNNTMLSQYLLDSDDYTGYDSANFADDYRDVATPDALPDGAFLIDEGNDRIYIKPGALLTNANITNNLVEVSVRPHETYAVGGDFPHLVKLHAAKNFRMSGIRVVHAAVGVVDTTISLPSDNFKVFYGMLIQGGSNVIIDNCEFVQNNGAGLSVTGTRFTYSNVIIRSNGYIGAGGGGGANNVHIYNVDISYNAWRAYEGGNTFWGPCGTKFGLIHDMTIDNVHVYKNYATGLWLDTDFKNVLITNSIFASNISLPNKTGGKGLYLETLQGPIFVHDCAMINNDVNGLTVVCTSRLDVSNTLIASNADEQILISSYNRTDAGNAPGGDFELGTTYDTVFSTNIRVLGNTILSSDADAFHIALSTSKDVTNYSHIFPTLTFENNVYYDFVNTNSMGRFLFLTNDGGTTNFVTNTFPAWQTVMGKDSNSVWGDPALSWSVPISAPSLIVALSNGSTNGITLVWTRSTEDARFSHYNVYRGTNAGFTPSDTTLIATNGNATNFTDTNAKENGAYFYSVTAETKYLGYESTVPASFNLVVYDAPAWVSYAHWTGDIASPAHISAFPLHGDADAYVTWAEVHDIRVASYNVYRGTSNEFAIGDATCIASNVSTVFYADTNQPASGTYYYTVAAKSHAGTVSTNSAFASIAVVKAATATAPGITGNGIVRATEQGHAEFALSFSGVTPTASKRVRLRITDVAGRIVADIDKTTEDPFVRWDGRTLHMRNAPAGVYIAHLVVEQGNVTREHTDVFILTR